MQNGINNTRDYTPPDFKLRELGLEERIKASLRLVVYPYLNIATTIYLRRRFPFLKEIPAKKLLYGQRGNDYLAHRIRLNSFYPIRGSNILIQGCGMGKDVLSWLSWGARSITAIDLFNYEQAWTSIKQFARRKGYTTSLSFKQMETGNMKELRASSFDIIASDAVYEHINNLGKALDESYRVLRPGGLVYATFGPLYYSYGGDHFSGRGGLREGYNHLLLDERGYREYINSFSSKPGHTREQDGRTWIHGELFSYLKYDQYLSLFEQKGFQRLYLFAIISEKAVGFRHRFPDVWQELLGEGIEEVDLMVNALSVILQKGERK